MTIMLMDNGSTRVDAAVQLRYLAKSLSHRTGKKIHAVSLKHSNRIAADDVNNKLGGIPARIFTEFISEQLIAGNREFLLIPLFFGKSSALTSFVPDKKAELESQFGSFKLSMTEVLYPLPDGDPLLVDILYEHATFAVKEDFIVKEDLIVKENLVIKEGLVVKKNLAIKENNPERDGKYNNEDNNTLKNIVLVDHGSPLVAVNAVRQHIANALNAKLPNGVVISQAVMERRKGTEYDFNGELLEDFLSRTAQSGETHATVLLLFLLAGTHAGENGDITQICDAVTKQYPHFKISISALVGQHKKLIDCLAQRLRTSN